MHGSHALYSVNPAGLWKPFPLAVVKNSWQLTYGYIVASALSGRGLRLNCLYLEYENVAAPDDEVTIPGFSEQDDRSYYENLAASLTRDYLRIAIAIPGAIDPAPGQESFFEEGQGNMLTLFGESSGTQGMTGKAFSDVANSKLCGVAVVAAPDLADRTQDILFARSYYPVDKQQLKPSNGGFGVRYSLTFAT